jgi:flavin-dependent dehydrogenase
MDERPNRYDVIVVGARVAGAATAMLMARAGRRVLMLDRARYGTDTLSTHALMRGSVLLLSRWGLLDRITGAGTPPIRETRFDYGTDDVSVAIKPTPGVPALYAPRRTLLDAVLVDAAAEAGAQMRFGVRITGLLRDGRGQVVGVHGRDRTGTEVVARAGLVVGADGHRSTVAQEAGVVTRRRGRGAGTIIYGYWSDLPASGYEWFYRPGHSAGIIPTNGGEACVFAGAPARTGVVGDYRRLLEAATGGAGGRLKQARPPHRLRTWVGQAGFVRPANGPGWVLVGDAGSFLDPLSTHGITDALRDAELLTRAIAGACGERDLDAATGRFATTRDDVIDPLFRAVDRIAAYQWNLAQLRGYLLDHHAAMRAEIEALNDDRVSVRPGRPPGL